MPLLTKLYRMAGISDGVKSWLLDKYAKFVEVKNSEGLPGISAESKSFKNGGEWKQFSSLEGNGSLQITLIESKHLMLSCGTHIKESFALVNASQWLKAICKGDSLLFLLKVNDETRRFRVKFANTGTKNASDNCHDFVNHVSLIFPVKIIPVQECTAGASQSFAEDSQLFSTPPTNNTVSQATQEVSFENAMRLSGSTIPEITRQVLSREQAHPLCHMSTNLPTSDLPMLIRLCLTDPGFPDFVEKVEEELKVLTSQS